MHHQQAQDKAISELKDEQTLIVYGVLASLKGLREQGCNSPVSAAINKIEKHLNKQALYALIIHEKRVLVNRKFMFFVKKSRKIIDYYSIKLYYKAKELILWVHLRV